MNSTIIYYEKGVIQLKRFYNPYLLPKWARKTRKIIRDLSIPFIIYQLIRVIIYPTQFDIILLLLFIIIALLLWAEIA